MSVKKNMGARASVSPVLSRAARSGEREIIRSPERTEN